MTHTIRGPLARPVWFSAILLSCPQASLSSASMSSITLSRAVSMAAAHSSGSRVPGLPNLPLASPAVLLTRSDKSEVLPPPLADVAVA